MYLIIFQYAYAYALQLVKDNPTSYGTYPDLAVHLLSSELQKTLSVNFFIPDTEDRIVAAAVVQVKVLYYFMLLYIAVSLIFLFKKY